MEEMAALTETAYGELLSHTRPRVIKTEAENERVIAELEALDSLGRPLSGEEEALAELLTLLVQQFEATRYPLGRLDPVDALRELMRTRGLRQRDLIAIFGASSTVSDVLNGKRAISKSHARKLAESYQVPVSLFI
jgi:HTH-type transcriptional regulator/antitoxin HigA